AGAPAATTIPTKAGTQACLQHRTSSALVGRQRWVNVARPGVDAAGQIGDTAEAAGRQKLGRPAAAPTGLAHDHQLGAAVQLVDPTWHFGERNGERSGQAHNLALPRLAYIEHRQ